MLKKILFITLIKLIFSNVSILDPIELQNLFKNKNNSISVVYANFGRIPYGYHLVKIKIKISPENFTLTPTTLTSTVHVNL